MGRKKKLPKEVQAMVDGGLNMLNIIISIVGVVRDLAVELGKSTQEWTEAIHRLSRPEGIQTLRTIAALILGQTTAIVQRTWQELLDACKQDWKNPSFTEARWPLEPVASDESEWVAEEYFFHDDASGTEKLRRLAEMVKKGEIRICGVRRAMEYVATHLDVQLDHPLVVPVSAQGAGGDLCLPTFDCSWDDGRLRRLSLYFVSSRFYPICAWLVLCKRP